MAGIDSVHRFRSPWIQALPRRGNFVGRAPLVYLRRRKAFRL